MPKGGSILTLGENAKEFIAGMRRRLREPGYSQPNIDLFQVARFHRCLPWFSPCEFNPAERDYWYRSLARYTRLTRELGTILQEFEQHRIQYFPFKGPVWQQLLAPGLPFRQCTDLDVFVHPHQSYEAFDRLQTLGYLNVYDLTAVQLQTLVSRVFSMEFRHKKNGFVIDLHWDITEGYCRQPFSDDDLRHLTKQSRNEQNSAFDDSVILFMVLMHGAKNHYEKLIYVADLFCWQWQHPNWNWEHEVQRYKKTGLLRFLTVGFGIDTRLAGLIAAATCAPGSEPGQNGAPTRRGNKTEF
ncbi:MAG: nucleotidyltransferase family protein [candidate division KSB1 bacterium]|nr:nucleotidyltransferase family protein [candidate division KSB1 bacterium]